MRRQFIAQIALPDLATFGLLPAQLDHFAQQQIQLLLLAKDGLVQLVQQVFGVAGLDLQFSQAGIGVVRLVHARIGPENQAQGINATSAAMTLS